MGRNMKRCLFRIGAFAGSLVIGVGILLAVFLGLEELRKLLGTLGVVILTAAVLLGAILGQAKDIAGQLAVADRKDIDPNAAWSVLFGNLMSALTASFDDKHGPQFLFRLLEWVALAVAGGLLSTLF